MGLLGKIMVKLGLDSSEFQKGAKDAESTTASFGDKIKGLAARAAAAIGVLSLLKKAFDFGKEAYNTAAQAEGVERAFARLNNPNLLNELREATRGTVSDLELMQNAIQAKNFKIPLGNLASYLKFANQRAKETGQSVDYLVQSIVLGVGRKSPLILDNLGISALEVREEFAKTGDMAKAVANIIDREMGEAGETVNGSKEKIGQASSAWKNALVEFGKIGPIKEMGDWFKSTSTEIANFITQASKAAKSPNLNGWQSFWAFINPNYAKQIQSERILFDLKQKRAKSEPDNRYWDLFSQRATYSADEIEQALERIKNKEIDVSKEYWYDPIEAANFATALENQLVIMREQETEAKKQQEIREKSRQGIREQIAELEQLAEVETDPKILISLDIQIAKLKARLGVVKETKENFKKGSIGDLENQKSKLEKRVRLTVDDSERRNLLKDISDIDAQLKLKLKFEQPKTERQVIEDTIKGYEDQQLAIPIGLGSPDEIKAAQKEWNRLQELIKQAKEELEKFPKAPKEIFPVGSFADFDQQIAEIDENIKNLTDSELKAAQAARAMLEFQKEGVNGGWQTQYEKEVAWLDQLKLSLESATEARKAYIQEAIDAQQEIVDNLGKTEQQIVDFGTQLSSQLGSAIAGSLGTMFDALFSGDEEQSAEEKTQAVLQPFADMIVQLGEYTLAMGVAGVAIKALIKNPWTAIAAGAALIALGKVAQAGVKNITSGQGASVTNPNTFTGGYSNGGSSTRAAQSLQLVSPQPQVVVLETRVNGSDIVLAAKKEEQRRKR